MAGKHKGRDGFPAQHGGRALRCPAHYAGRKPIAAFLLCLPYRHAPPSSFSHGQRAYVTTSIERLRGTLERRPLPRTPTGDPLSLLGGLRRPPADAPITVAGLHWVVWPSHADWSWLRGASNVALPPAPPGRVFFMVCCHVGVAHVLGSYWLHCAHVRKRRWAPIGAHPSDKCGLKLHPAANAVIDKSTFVLLRPQVLHQVGIKSKRG